MIYYQVMKKMSNRFDLRLRMVRMAEEEGISVAARYYRTTRKTAYKWVRRHEQGGLRALEDCGRAPKQIPHKIPQELERKIVRLRRRYPGWGPKGRKTYFDLPCSEAAIHRVLRQNGLIRKRKKKWKKRRDLRNLKAALKPFEKIILKTQPKTPYLEEGISWGLPCVPDSVRRITDRDPTLPASAKRI